MSDAADPVGDQITAAARDAADRFEAAVKQVAGGDTEQKHPGRVVADVVTRFMEALRGGKAMKCEHLVGGPQVIFGAACLPGVVGCASCISQHAEFRRQLDAVTGSGRICDGCKERAPWGHTGMVQNGPLLLTVSLCNPCMETDQATPLSEDDSKGYW